MPQVCRLKTATMAIQTTEGQASPVIVPKDAMLTVTGSLVDESGFVKCSWNGTEVLVMILDLHERCSAVDDVASES